MQELRYSDEVKPLEEVPIGPAEVKEAELKLAIQLIEQIASEDFQPKKYKDEVKARILAQIERKVQGEQVTVAPTAEPQAKIIDLMEALKASLARAPSSVSAAEDDERKPPKRAGRKSEAAPSRSKGSK
jgi:DNA end-binding protein Ku